MSELSAIKNDLIRLNTLLTDSEERNIKHVHRTLELEIKFERIKAVQKIVEIKAHSTADLLAGGAVAENDPFLSAMLIAYDDLNKLLDKALNTDEDLFKIAMENPTG